MLDSIVRIDRTWWWPWQSAQRRSPLVGLIDAPILIGTFTARNRNSPPEQRSTVFTVGSSAKLATSSIGALAAGYWLDTAATSAGLLAIGVVSVAAAALGFWAADTPRV